MFQVKKTIPALAVTGLALTGCGSSGGGGASSIRNAYCEKANECDGTSISICKAVFDDFIDDLPPACADAYLALYDCFTEESCADFPSSPEDPVPNDCLDELQEAYVVCS